MSRKSDSNGLGSDLERLRNMRDEGVDCSDIPPITPEQLARGVIRIGLKPMPRKKQATLRWDTDTPG